MLSQEAQAVRQLSNDKFTIFKSLIAPILPLCVICCTAPRLCCISLTAALHCTALHCTALHCTALHCTALHCTALHCTALHCTALHCTALHCTALHCTALHCTALHCTALHNCSNARVRYKITCWYSRKKSSSN